MALTTTQKSDFITRYRTALSAAMDADDQIAALKRTWDALGLGGVLTDADFTGTNAGLTAADFATAVGDYATQIAPAWTAPGFPTVFNKIRNV